MVCECICSFVAVWVRGVIHVGFRYRWFGWGTGETKPDCRFDQGVGTFTSVGIGTCVGGMWAVCDAMAEHVMII